MIPEAAVDVALAALLTHYGYTSDEVNAGGPTITDEREHGKRLVTTLLEAAAPHMFAPVLALADEMDNVHGSIRGHVTTYQLRQALGVSDD